MKFDFTGIKVGYQKENTLDRAYSLATKSIEDQTGLSFSKEEASQAQKGLSPVFMGGLDNCLQAYGEALIKNKQEIAA